MWVSHRSHVHSRSYNHKSHRRHDDIWKHVRHGSIPDDDARTSMMTVIRDNGTTPDGMDSFEDDVIDGNDIMMAATG